MLEPPAANLLAELLQALNPTARIQRTVFARVSLACLIADDRDNGGDCGGGLGGGPGGGGGGGGHAGTSEGTENPLANLLRSKGFVWLASQPRTCYKWAYAGCHFQLSEHSEFAEIDESNFNAPASLRPAPCAKAGTHVQGQELVFIGLALPEEELVELLDACILREWEMVFFRRGLVPPEHEPAGDASEPGGSSLLPGAAGLGEAAGRRGAGAIAAR
ncbi:hypothetical protein T492DRAFT_854785 [Pavlovales sp. CCMP2436]|nr:hypothetical protein T492DRAFT_854785 [Pavlovales sp. CCMP2436]